MLRRLSSSDEGLAEVIRLRQRLETLAPDGRGLPSLSIGRQVSGNSVVLVSPSLPLLLSRLHATVSYDGENFTLSDRNTTNGTYVRWDGFRRVALACERVH
jgi:pSer/pThr/pTyr-binding forkhead associated (FHA) protein